VVRNPVLCFLVTAQPSRADVMSNHLATFKRVRPANRSLRFTLWIRRLPRHTGDVGQAQLGGKDTPRVNSQA
jgi:hypothetical protein